MYLTKIFILGDVGFKTFFDFIDWLTVDCGAEVRRQLADGTDKSPPSHRKTATPDSIIYGNAS